MTGSLAEFNQLTDTEQYFRFFKLDYDAKVVNINRLHILKQFSNSIKEIDASFPELSDEDRLTQYRTALIQAYDLFMESSGVEQKLFKVFNEKPNNIVMLRDLTK